MEHGSRYRTSPRSTPGSGTGSNDWAGRISRRARSSSRPQPFGGIGGGLLRNHICRCRARIKHQTQHGKAHTRAAIHRCERAFYSGLLTHRQFDLKAVAAIPELSWSQTTKSTIQHGRCGFRRGIYHGELVWTVTKSSVARPLPPLVMTHERAPRLCHSLASSNPPPGQCRRHLDLRAMQGTAIQPENWNETEAKTKSRRVVMIPKDNCLERCLSRYRAVYCRPYVE